MRIDARLPVRFGTLADARDGDALLLPPGAAVPLGWPGAVLDAGPGDAGPGDAGLGDARLGDAGLGHVAGCACCLPRNAAAQALGALFLRRARGEVPLFRGVLAVVGRGGWNDVRAALEGDPLVSGRYRLA